jgi:hypothetical protein
MPFHRRRRPRIVAVVLLATAGGLLTACVAAPAAEQDPGQVALQAPTAGATTIAADDELSAAIAVSETLFAESPVVVVADAASQEVAAEAAVEAGVPVFPLPGAEPEGSGGSAADENGTAEAGTGRDVTTGGAALADEIARLGASRVVVVGAAGPADDDLDLGEADRVEVEAEPAAVSAAIGPRPERADPEGLGGPVALVATAETAPAAQAVARASGATVIEQPSAGDILGQPSVIEALGELRPAATLLLTTREAPQPAPDWSVRSAVTGYQLPGGGQRLFGDHRFVALYGVPGVPVLGVLGEQGVAETIARAQSVASEYAPLSDLPVVPTLELIATVAAGDAGADGDYSNELDPARLEEYVDAAEAAGQYVVIDLQPGRTDFLTQATAYRSLLEHPNVGLALDPEWRLGPDQVPLEQIGSVDAAEVNAVAHWLADLVDAGSLPPKMLVLHQFRGSMITGREAIDTSLPQLELLVHVDGQGSQPDKQGTWRALLELPPHGAAVGWKNFLDEDAPVLTPAQTMSEVSPVPDFISYQ